MPIVPINHDDVKRWARELRRAGWMWKARDRKWINRARGIMQQVAMDYQEATWFVYHRYHKGGKRDNDSGGH